MMVRDTRFSAPRNRDCRASQGSSSHANKPASTRLRAVWRKMRPLLSMLAMSLAFWASGPASAQAAENDPVFYVVYQDVKDERRFAAYVDAVTPAIARRGGVLVAAGAPSFTEGSAPYGRLVVFRYPTRRALEAFLASDEYARIRALRVGAADWLSAIVPALPEVR